jgi:hypothetical protein
MRTRNIWGECWYQATEGYGRVTRSVLQFIRSTTCYMYAYVNISYAWLWYGTCLRHSGDDTWYGTPW